MKSFPVLILILMLKLPMVINGQDKNVKKVDQQWVQYYTQTKLSDKWIWSADAGFRYNKIFNNPSQYIVRTGLNYQLSPHMKVGAGFAHLGFYTSKKLSKVEYRPYQELSINDKYNRLSVSHRVRIEERYFKTVSSGVIQSSHAFNFRFRYQFLLNLEILKLSSRSDFPLLSFGLSDEIFINAGKEIIYNVFDQNRFVIGPSVSFSKNFIVGMNYNSQFAAVNAPGSYVHTKVLWLTVRQNFSIAKHKKQTAQ